MDKKKIYLDYNATAPIKPAVKDVMIKMMDQVGNPSSIHGFGREAQMTIEQARNQLADLVGCRPANIVFTAGATEANNTIIHSFKNDKQLLVLSTEHPSILKTTERLTLIPVLQNGLVDLDALKETLAQNPNNSCLVSIQWVNSETGVIQPMDAIKTLCEEHDALLHSDATQALGRIPVNMKEMGIDYLSLSAHKMGGPQGVGALIAADLKPFDSLIKGGGQERRRRAGTENVAGIAGLGVAAELSKQGMDSYNETLSPLQKTIEAHIEQTCPDAIIMGKDTPRVCNTINVSVPSINAQMAMMGFDLKGVAISTGSACSSGSIEPSHVIRAMGYNDDIAGSSLRISMGWQTTKEDVDYFLSIWDQVILKN